MKQTTIKLLCAGLMMTAAACSSDPETENVAPQGERAQMSFTATSAETRTELVDKTKVHWQATKSPFSARKVTRDTLTTISQRPKAARQ